MDKEYLFHKALLMLMQQTVMTTTVKNVRRGLMKGYQRLTLQIIAQINLKNAIALYSASKQQNRIRGILYVQIIPVLHILALYLIL